MFSAKLNQPFPKLPREFQNHSTKNKRVTCLFHHFSKIGGGEEINKYMAVVIKAVI
jgi:hypothetical protein